MGRGDRRYADIIEAAWRQGPVSTCGTTASTTPSAGGVRPGGTDIETAAQRRFAVDERLPWSHLGAPTRTIC